MKKERPGLNFFLCVSFFFTFWLDFFYLWIWFSFNETTKLSPWDSEIFLCSCMFSFLFILFHVKYIFDFTHLWCYQTWSHIFALVFGVYMYFIIHTIIFSAIFGIAKQSKNKMQEASKQPKSLLNTSENLNVSPLYELKTENLYFLFVAKAEWKQVFSIFSTKFRK